MENTDTADYREEHLGRTVTAHIDEQDDSGSPCATVQIAVTDNETEEEIELTRHELRELNRAVGMEERRPPKRDIVGTVENHLEIMDFGDFLSVNTPPARFRISHTDYRDVPMWRITEHDEGHSWEIDTAQTRRAATIELLERLGVLWDEGATDEDGELS
jgi:hypothetical protein